MTVYYRDDSVEVTSSRLRVEAAAYPISQLEYVWHTRSRFTSRGAARRLVRWLIVTALTVPGVLLALFLIGLPFIQVDGDLNLGVLALGVAACVVLAIALAPLLEVPLTMLDRINDRGVEQHELWAQIVGEQVLLLQTHDATKFGQIYRAVQRAVEETG
ncbi:DUF6232 family protein [Catenuloplanes indicus]|uniref:Uncharacterized protein n=1 Tax=Catenuloplanes indicus TaxID=137267 RepID=A0AAE3W3M0_9ACTN|nr:DUF6232 family protein [Catenuloplanes indicus]MDQ0368904.1 hypothetical protein [Catenuloplanes indicus]